MKAQILKIAGVKSEADFYKKFPDEASFMKVHGKEFKKAMAGAKITVAQNGLSGLGYDPEQPIDPTRYNLMGDPGFSSREAEIIPLMQTSAQRGGSSLASLLPSQQPKLAPNNHKAPGGTGFMDMLKSNTDLPGKIIGGIQGLIDEKKNRLNAEKWNMVSDVTRRASESEDMDAQRQIEDTMRKKRESMMPVNTGEEFFPIYGVGTNPLAKNGRKVKGEIMNVGSLQMPIAASGFETFLNAGGANMIGNATNMLYGENAGSTLGGDVGGAVGSIFGPVGGMVGSEVGKLAGWALDRNPAKMKRAQDSMNANIGIMGINNGMKGIQNQYASYMENGGYVSNDWVPQVITRFGEHRLSDLLRPDPTMDTLRTGGNIRQNTPDMEQNGELQVHWGGHAEPISYNPYLPDGGEMIQFKGNSHEQSENGRSGIGITFGNSPVEVENEPAVKLADGGTAGPALTVFGNMKIGKQGASIIGDPDAANKKFKGYAKQLADKTARVNKLVDDSTTKINDITPITSFDKLSLNSLHANLMGADMKLKEYADKTKKAGDYQNAINQLAEENGLVADKLAEGKLQQAKRGLTIGKADRKSWDIPGRVADWAGEKLGQAYEEYVPQAAKNIIEPVGEAINRVSEWPFTPEYREEHPINAGVAPGVGIAGKAAKAAKTAKVAKKVTQEEKLAKVLKDVRESPERINNMKEKARIESKISKFTAEDLKNPNIYDDLSEAEIKALESKFAGTEFHEPLDEAASIGRSSEESINAYNEVKFPELTKEEVRYNKLKSKLTEKPPQVGPKRESSGVSWGWPVGIGSTGLVGAGIAAYMNRTPEQAPPSPQSIEQLNKTTPAGQGSGQMNPLYNAMQKDFKQFQKGGEAAAWKAPWQTTKPYLPWAPQEQPRVAPDMVPGDTMTQAQVDSQLAKYRPRPTPKAAVPTQGHVGLPMYDDIAKLPEYTRDMAIQDIGSPIQLANVGQEDYEELTPSKDNKFWWTDALASMMPYFRPSDAEKLDPRQLAGEMYALSTNQVEPVQAQTYQPRLRTPYDISMQDQLNEVHAQTRAAQRLAGYNPAAQAAIAGQAYAPESKILAEQFRVNQGMKNQVYDQNLATLNDAQLKNLGIFDQQYQRQAGAKSATKATTQAALNSISAKYLQNQMEQRQLQTMENLYGYRFGPGMRAQNWNGPAQFNMSGNNTRTNSSGIIRNEKGEELLPVMDKTGEVTRYIVKDTSTKGKGKTGRNGSIVHAFRNL